MWDLLGTFGICRLCRLGSRLFWLRKAPDFLPPAVQAGPRDAAFWRERRLQCRHDFVKGEGVKPGLNEGFDLWIGFNFERDAGLVGGAVGAFTSTFIGSLKPPLTPCSMVAKSRSISANLPRTVSTIRTGLP